MHLRWAGFRRVRRQVCRRLARRLRDLGLGGLDAYRALLDADPGEWRALDALCRIPISRFLRDRATFERLLALLPPGPLDVWCAGCASGEEPYTLALLRPGLRILATDADPHLLGRARRGCYRASSLRALPSLEAFDRAGDEYCLRPGPRAGVRFELQDLREAMPGGPFHAVLCRNLAFTYFDEALQRRVLDGILARLRPPRLLVVGRHESPPAGLRALGCGVFEAPEPSRS